MEYYKHDLPTLHRPAALDDEAGVDVIDMRNDLTGGLNPIATPPHKQYSRFRRSHTSMSYGRESGNKYGTLPTIMTETNWRTRRAKQHTSEGLPNGSDYDNCYEELSKQKAYRHPHPGAAKGREGCMGGTWRHAKEAIGYGPGRLMWIDGIVTLYDDWALNNEKPWSRGKTQYAFNRSTAPLNIDEEWNQPRRFIPQRNQIPLDKSRWYSSNRPQPLPVGKSSIVSSAPNTKYKGFYSMAQTYS